jgi:hypothetical protein
MSTSYNITYILTNEQDQQSNGAVLGQLSSENEPNLDIVFGYIARSEPELEKAQTLLIKVQPLGGLIKSVAELGQTPIRQMLKRQGLKQILTARKSDKLVITITVAIGATNNPLSSKCEISNEAVSAAPIEFAQAVRLAENGDIGSVRKFLEVLDYDCTVKIVAENNN